MKLFKSTILAVKFLIITLTSAFSEDIYTCKFTQTISMYGEGNLFQGPVIGKNFGIRVSPYKLTIHGTGFSENQVWTIDYYTPNDWSAGSRFQVIRFKKNTLNYLYHGLFGTGGTISLA